MTAPHVLDHPTRPDEHSKNVKAFDFVGAIELAYDREKNDAAWLADIVRAVAPAFSPGPPTTGYFFELVGDDAQLTTFSSVGATPYRREQYQHHHELGPVVTGKKQRVAYECDMITLLSRVIGVEAAARTIRMAGMDADDALGLRANMSPEEGIILTTHVPRGFRIRQRGLWIRFAAHLGSALRLRRAQRRPSPETARAVLTPRGRLEHGSAEAIAAREQLAGAAQDMDRARGKLRRLDQAAACELWRTMVRGEWTLVDWFDHDGKRFLLAEANHVPGAPQRPLTARERQVVACAAMGHSNKLIAYDLGLSTGTVSVMLTRASKKLGVSGRVALIRAFRESERRRLRRERRG